MLKKSPFLVIAALTAISCTFALVGWAQSAQLEKLLQPERFDGIFANNGAAIPSLQGTYFTLQVDQWTSDEEWVSLLTLLRDGGNRLLRDKLDNSQPKGAFRIRNGANTYVYITRSTILPTGERVIWAITKTQLGFLKTGDARTIDFPFGLIQLLFDKSGKGNGDIKGAIKLILAADGTATIESYGTPPFKLLDAKASAIAKRK